MLPIPTGEKNKNKNRGWISLLAISLREEIWNFLLFYVKENKFILVKKNTQQCFSDFYNACTHITGEFIKFWFLFKETKFSKFMQREEFIATKWNVKLNFTFIYKGTLKYLNRPNIILFQVC